MISADDKAKVQSWLADHDFKGSILIRFQIDRSDNRILLISSYPVGTNKKYQYKFRMTNFLGVRSINRSKPGSRHYQFAPDFYQAGESIGTVELEQIDLRTYVNNYRIELDFGHNFGTCEFEFLQIQKMLKKGKIITERGRKFILDSMSGNTIEYESPFDLN